MKHYIQLLVVECHFVAGGTDVTYVEGLANVRLGWSIRTVPLGAAWRQDAGWQLLYMLAIFGGVGKMLRKRIRKESHGWSQN